MGMGMKKAGLGKFDNSRVYLGINIKREMIVSLRFL
jgi:hypothetical protein